MAKAKISDVAREAGVSLGTVSNALNHPDKVHPDTLALINRAIDHLGYVPNQAARQLAGRKNRMFGLVLPRLDHAFSLQIANGAQAESRDHGYDLLIASAGNDEILENHYMRYFQGAQVAGVLVQPMADDSWRPRRDMTRVPAVYLDIHGSEQGVFVAADNEGQGREMLAHALSCGAKNIAVIGSQQFMQLSLRVKGMLDAAAKEDISIEVIDRGSWNTAEDGYELGSELAKRQTAEDGEGKRAIGVRPDFIIALTDVLAAGVIEGVESAGLNVPGDIMVAGCDGNPLAWGGSVSLTTLTSPGYEIGRAGVRLLLKQIAGERIRFHQELVESTLVERASTAASRAARQRVAVPGINLGEYL